MTGTPIRIVVLCTGNSARSQMLEAILEARLGDRVQVESAGTEPAKEVHPLAIRALAEIGIPWGDGEPKAVGDLPPPAFDVAITVCDHAKETCPVLPGVPRRVHVGYPDPAAAEGSGEERLDAFRRVRDHMKSWVEIAAMVSGL